MIPVTITVWESYTAELRQRLKESDISLGALSRELETDRSQVARWFNQGVEPRLHTVLKIERAVTTIEQRKLLSDVLHSQEYLAYRYMANELGQDADAIDS